MYYQHSFFHDLATALHTHHIDSSAAHHSTIQHVANSPSDTKSSGTALAVSKLDRFQVTLVSGNWRRKRSSNSVGSAFGSTMSTCCRCSSLASPIVEKTEENCPVRCERREDGADARMTAELKVGKWLGCNVAMLAVIVGARTWRDVYRYRTSSIEVEDGRVGTL